jgi:hypothetical protein
LAHQQGEVVAGDVKQVSLVQVLAPAVPSSAHAAAIEVVGKGALDDLGAQLEGLAGDPGLEPRGLLVTARRAASSPRQREKPFCLGSTIPCLPGAVVQGLQERA